jgi:hypothetical protein
MSEPSFTIPESCELCPFYERSDGGDYPDGHYCNADIVGFKDSACVAIGSKWSSRPIPNNHCPGPGVYEVKRTYRHKDFMHY